MQMLVSHWTGISGELLSRFACAATLLPNSNMAVFSDSL